MDQGWPGAGGLWRYYTPKCDQFTTRCHTRWMEIRSSIQRESGKFFPLHGNEIYSPNILKYGPSTKATNDISVLVVLYTTVTTTWSWICFHWIVVWSCRNFLPLLYWQVKRVYYLKIKCMLDQICKSYVLMSIFIHSLWILNQDSWLF